MSGLKRFLGVSLKKRLVFVTIMAASLLMGCASSQPSPSPYMLPGAGIGGALGAGIGAAVNHNNPWRGAAIGGLLGAAGGAIGGEAYGRSRVPDQPQSYYPPQQQQQGYYQEQQPYYGQPPS
jgi:hypothetical protein